MTSYSLELTDEVTYTEHKEEMGSNIGFVIFINGNNYTSNASNMNITESMGDITILKLNCFITPGQKEDFDVGKYVKIYYKGILKFYGKIDIVNYSSDSSLSIHAKEVGANKLSQFTTPNDFRVDSTATSTISSYLRSTGRLSTRRGVLGDKKLNDPTSVTFRAEKNNCLTAFSNLATVRGDEWQIVPDGLACDYNGSDEYHSSTDLTDVATDTIGTVSLWIYVDDNTSSGMPLTFSRNADANDTRPLSIAQATTYLNVSCRVDGTDQWAFNTNGVWNNFENNTWYHILITHNGTEPTFYIDNVEVSGTFTTSTDKTKWLKAGITDATYKCDRMTIGGRLQNGSLNYPFNGRVTDVRYYSSVITQAGRNYLYNNGYGTSNQIGNEVYHYRPMTADVTDFYDYGSAANDLTGTNISQENWVKATVANDNPLLTLSGEIASRYAINLDGIEDFGYILDLSDVATDTIGTVSLWVKVNELDDAQTLFSFARNTDSTLTQLTLNISSGDYLLANCYVDNVRQWEVITNTQGGYLTTDNWFHLVMTHDGVEPRLYINNTLCTLSYVDSNNLTQWVKAVLTDASSKSDNLSIGAFIRNSSATLHTDGCIDDVRYFNRVITDAEREVIYAQGVGTTASLGDEVYWWMFDEEFGRTTTADSGSAGNDLMIFYMDHRNFIPKPVVVQTYYTYGSNQNAVLISRSKDTRRLWNRIKVLGYGDGLRQVGSIDTATTTASDTLNGALSATATTISLNDSTGFTTTGGVILIDDEIIQFTGVSSNDLTGCTRGTHGTDAATHTSATAVVEHPYFVEDTTSQSTYGVVEYNWRDSTIRDYALATVLANKILNEHKNPVEVVKFRTLNYDPLTTPINIGDAVILDDFDITFKSTDVNVFRIVGREINYGLSGNYVLFTGASKTYDFIMDAYNSSVNANNNNMQQINEDGALTVASLTNTATNIVSSLLAFLTGGSTSPFLNNTSVAAFLNGTSTSAFLTSGGTANFLTDVSGISGTVDTGQNIPSANNAHSSDTNTSTSGGGGSSVSSTVSASGTNTITTSWGSGLGNATIASGSYQMIIGRICFYVNSMSGASAGYIDISFSDGSTTVIYPLYILNNHGYNVTCVWPFNSTGAPTLYFDGKVTAPISNASLTFYWIAEGYGKHTHDISATAAGGLVNNSAITLVQETPGTALIDVTMDTIGKSTAAAVTSSGTGNALTSTATGNALNSTSTGNAVTSGSTDNAYSSVTPTSITTSSTDDDRVKTTTG